MRFLFILLGHLLTTIAKLVRPGGGRAIVAESVLLKQQLLVVGRSRHRTPNFSPLDRFLFGFWGVGGEFQFVAENQRFGRVAQEGAGEAWGGHCAREA